MQPAAAGEPKCRPPKSSASSRVWEGFRTVFGKGTSFTRAVKPHKISRAGGFDFAGIRNTEGAPSFAHFAKGGNHEHMRNGFRAETDKVLSAATPPTLAKNARMGHPQLKRSRQKHHRQGRATRPTFILSFRTGLKAR